VERVDQPPGEPIVLVVDERPERVRDELASRYATHYRIATATSAREATARLDEWERSGAVVAVVMVEHQLADAAHVFERARATAPQARRGVSFPEGSGEATVLVPRAMAGGLIDFFIAQPMSAGDEAFHLAMSEVLYAWSRTAPPETVAVAVIGDRSSPKSFEVRDLLARNSVPYVFHATDSVEGARMLAGLGVGADRLPVFVLFNGTVLFDPDYDEVVRALGSAFEAPSERVDVAVIGAGPAGLAAAVSAASEGLATVVLEREAVGGQAGTSSLIRNYPGFPHGIAGRELATRAARQAWAFGTRFHWMHSAVELRPDDGGWVVGLSDGATVRARTVVVASGVSWRRLDVPRVDELLGSGVFYGPALSEAPAMEDGRVFVVGGGNSAGQAAVHLARYAEQVCLLVRGDTLASSMSDYLVRELQAVANIEVRFDTTVAACGGEHRLEQITTRHAPTGVDRTEHADGLFVLIGGEPRTDWLPRSLGRDRWGYILTGPDVIGPSRRQTEWSLERAPYPFESNHPGVFAAGDVRHGSMKRVAAAVGEGASVVRSCHTFLETAGLSR
jgi:thioredoxin reductase (NADPH)